MALTFSFLNDLGMRETEQPLMGMAVAPKCPPLPLGAPGEVSGGGTMCHQSPRVPLSPSKRVAVRSGPRFPPAATCRHPRRCLGAGMLGQSGQGQSGQGQSRLGQSGLAHRAPGLGLQQRPQEREGLAKRAAQERQELSESFVPGTVAGDLPASQGLSLPLSKASPRARSRRPQRPGPHRAPDMARNNAACLPDRLSAFFSSRRKRAPAGSANPRVNR